MHIFAEKQDFQTFTFYFIAFFAYKLVDFCDIFEECSKSITSELKEDKSYVEEVCVSFCTLTAGYCYAYVNNIGGKA